MAPIIPDNTQDPTVAPASSRPPTPVPQLDRPIDVARFAIERAPAPTILLVEDSFKIMIAGESGLGKSTFINNIFSSYNGGRPIMPDHAASGETGGEAVLPAGVAPDDGSAEEGSLKPPTLAIDQSCVFATRNADQTMNITYRMVDTPGWGDDIDVSRSIARVTDFLLSCHRVYQERFTGQPYGVEKEDERVACILYFIAPHRIKPIDVEFMKQLSKLAPLIPVVGKADTMSKPSRSNLAAARKPSEVESFRRVVLKELKDNEISCFHEPPRVFFVGASKVYDPVRLQEDPAVYWPIREYPWGVCNILDPNHTDTGELKLSMLGKDYRNLQLRKREIYEAAVNDGRLGLVTSKTPICLSTQYRGSGGKMCTVYITRWLNGTPGAISAAQPSSEYENLHLQQLDDEKLHYGSVIGLKHSETQKFLCDQSGHLLPPRGLAWDRARANDFEQFKILEAPKESKKANAYGSPEEVEAILERLYVGSKIILRSLAVPDNETSYLYFDQNRRSYKKELNEAGRNFDNQYGFDLTIADKATVWTICNTKGQARPWSIP
ncbi:Putative septin GTPase [Klebsormidium nitens]|uniref:Putative septin GTPase n=1 Tax=Klebsormidium nitens TaxID=105231 RepID=A0A1Y1ITX3_KLENI|nr:Putative septin GTPase [Klebsormidium nitens]|eukprot:GAQ92127.1 Putative septin GTPase [Klebsormidium nitens]